MALDDIDALWEQFKKTGSIKSYLEFCEKRREKQENDS